MDKPSPRFRHEDVEALREAPSNNYFPPHPPLFITEDIDSLKDLRHNFESYKKSCLESLGSIYVEDIRFVIEYITNTFAHNSNVLRDNQSVVTLDDSLKDEIISDVKIYMFEYDKIREWIRKFSRLERPLNDEERDISNRCITYMQDHWTRDSFDLTNVLKELKDPNFSGRAELIKLVREIPGLSEDAKNNLIVLLR